MYHDIKQAYTGGHTDVYQAYGENLKIYDVNSLYPSAMRNFNMPIGPINFFEGDLKYCYDHEKFGYFFVEVISPKYMERPLLQVRIKTKEGLRSIAPLGNWKMWINSEEMNELTKYGYNFNIIKGYLFKKANIFKDFIDSLYEIKKSSKKNDPMYLISKLLMNSLYGRFGMDINLPRNSIMNNETITEFINNKTLEIEDILDLENGKSIVVYKNTKNKNDNDISTESQVNISIAAAITAYSRIIMSKYLGDNTIKIWMTDTDSIVTDAILPTSNELGDWKLEKECKEMTFIAPKVYGGISNTGEEFTKVKGFVNNLPYAELKSLLNENTILELSHNKTYKNIVDSNIELKNQIYTLQITSSKRRIVFENGIFKFTKPYLVEDNEIVHSSE